MSYHAIPLITGSERGGVAMKVPLVDLSSHHTSSQCSTVELNRDNFGVPAATACTILVFPEIGSCFINETYKNEKLINRYYQII